VENERADQLANRGIEEFVNSQAII
jgi:ribonuclease HI